MIIGIDASRALLAHPTGTERYSIEIIRHLLHASGATAHEWRLYVPFDPDREIFAIPGVEPADFCVRCLPRTRMWTHRRLGPQVVRDRPDVLFIPAHVLPVVPGRSLPATVVTVHDLGFLHFPEAHQPAARAYLRWSTEYAARHATRLIAVSEATRRDLLERTAAVEGAVRVVHEAASALPAVSPADVAAVTAAYGLKRPYALFVGTLQPRKNLSRLAEAYAQLVASGQAGFDLVLAGSPGPTGAPVAADLDRIGMPDRIRRLGYVPHDRMPALFRGARMFCYPSLFEGFGLPILEAQSAGVPVLTATNSSLPEVAGDAALLVDATDVNAIADALLRISRDEELRRTLIAAGYENVKRFSWQKAAAETLAVLEEAARARRR